MRAFSAILLAIFATTCLAAAPAEIRGVRVWQAPDSTRLVFDVSSPVEHKIFTLSNPDRIVIDLNNSRVKTSFDKLDLKQSTIKGIRSGKRKGNGLRVVLDLSKKVQPKSFVLKPNQEYGHRLVVDLNYENKAARADIPPVPVKTIKSNKSRDVIIAIDAGHGGEDPGARGHNGTREKDVVLAIARKLDRLVGKEKGMRALMVRTGDYYLPLRKRIDKARLHKADMFISIHADAFKDKRANGSSVYVLSSRGASSEAARWLAESENASDLVGGVVLDGKDDVLQAVLLDLSQTGTIEASMDVGADVLRELRRVGKVHRKSVQHAGFAVLKSPDVPSVLVETAFISNPSEERKLRSGAHQYKIANALMRGIRKYFRENAPPGTLIAKLKEQREVDQRHVVSRGDTLSHIAHKYQVSMGSLRKVNKLRNDRLIIGKILRIPTSDS